MPTTRPQQRSSKSPRPRTRHRCNADADTCETIHRAQLRYVTDNTPGISRQRRGKRFYYIGPDGKQITSPDILQRINAIVIPPAWQDVWISPWENGHIQATGRDARGRKQYRYHPDWSHARNETKYNRMIEFGERLPRIRSHVDAALRRKGLPREKVLATVVRLLELTHLRVGNEEYAADNDSYGLTTLRDRHVNCNTNGCRLSFRGKSGREHNVTFQDKQLARIVRRCHELPGQELFQYLAEDGTQQVVNSSDVNSYLREISGADFTAKDFRTWWGTVIAAEALLGFGPQHAKTRINKCIVDAIHRASGSLGNRPAACRKYYVHPAIIEGFTAGTLSEKLQASFTKAVKRCPQRMEPIECAVLEHLKETAPSKA